jgi:hypothetical protein
MPFVEDTPRGFNQFTAPEVDAPEPTFSETIGAAFRMENDVTNVLDALSRPAFAPQEGFQIGKSLRDYDVQNRSSLFEDYRDQFLGVSSEEEMLYKIQRIRKQEADRETISRAGWLGVTAAVSAGLASPTVFLPFVAGGRGVAAVARGAAAGLAGAVPSELALYANQETRTEGELAFGLAASTALGGILGGAVAALRPGERELFEQQLTQVARPGGLSADVAEPFVDAGGLATGAQTIARVNDATKVFTNPVTQTINQTEFESFRVLMQQLSDSGLQMAKNEDFIPASVGGTIENRLNFYTGMLVRSDDSFNDAYSKYYFDGAVPRVAPNLRAEIGGALSGQKLSAAQFADEVSRAIWNGFQHEVPEVVKAAQAISKEVYEPLLKMAQEVQLFPDDVKVVGDEAYVNRVYNTQAIKLKTQEFIDILTRHYEQNLNQRFADELEKFKGKQAKQTTLAEDLARPESEVEELQEKFREELKALDENLPEEIQMLEEAIATNRATLRAMRQAENVSIADEATMKQLRQDIRDMEAASPQYAEVKGKRRELRQRLSNLNKAVVAVDARRAAKLEKIEKTEELELNSLMRVVSKAQTILKKLDRVSDKVLDKEVSALKTMFNRAGEVYDRGEERLVKLAADEDPDFHRIGAVEDVQETRAHRLNEISDRLETAENLDRDSLRAVLEDGLNEALVKVNNLNSRRVLRSQRLKEQVAKLDPKIVEQRLLDAQSAPMRAEGDFARRWETEYKASSVDLEKGVADFRDVAKEAARDVTDKITGTYLRLPYSEVMQMERGAELRRVLHIPSQQIAEFLDTDIRSLTRIYTRTLGPDIELKRKFGTLNASEWIAPASEERYAKIEALSKAPKPENMTQEAWEAKITKRTGEINDQFELHKRNVEAVVQRLRGTRGLPSDPDGFAYRAARTIMNLNVLRMMGMVTVSSLPDVGRPIMRYGLTRAFRDGFVPMINNLKGLKLTRHEARLAGVANDVSAHMRALAFRDVTDELYRGNALEKGVEWATNRMGVVALFDYWTQAMETISSSVANAKLMDALARVNTGEGIMPLKEAETFLAENGFDGVLAERAWDQVKMGGGGKVEGVWWPNTENWSDQEALRTYRAALSREVYKTIPRPGAERALLSDANMVGRMLYQFKSFGMSSMAKITMAGAQQRDMAALSGALASMGMGMLSYYLWAVATGGKSYEEMLNAGPGKWADEAISRSGILGNAGEVQRIAQTIPLFQPYSSFSGTRQTRRPGDDVVEALFGPSFDFVQNATGVISGIDQPTQGTLKQLRRLTPFQNAVGLREAIDAVEEALGSKLPERRTK